jgi:hypothetical protein
MTTQEKQEMNNANEKRSGWKHKLVHELIAYWLNVLYLTIFFSVFTSYRRLLMAHYDISYTEWGISLIKALILAKVILIVDLLRISHSLEDRPLIVPTLYKTFIFSLFVALFAIMESAIRGFLQGKGLGGALDHLLSQGTSEFLSRCLVAFCAFIPYFAFKEIGRVLGKGELGELFFRKNRPGKVVWMDEK